MAAEVRDVEDRDHCLAVAEAFCADRPTRPTAADKIGDDHDYPLAFSDYPPLGPLEDLKSDRVDLLDRSSGEQGEEGPHSRWVGLAMADTLLRQRAPPRERTGGARERPYLGALVHPDATHRAGVVVGSNREIPGVAAGLVGWARDRFWGVLVPRSAQFPTPEWRGALGGEIRRTVRMTDRGPFVSSVVS